MKAFVGVYPEVIDNKGKTRFPKAFIDKMQENRHKYFIIRKDIFDSCLVLYTVDEWKKQNDTIHDHINPYKKEHNIFLRNFYAGITEIWLGFDNSITIPKYLLEKANIKNEIYFIGIDRKIEIVSKESKDLISQDGKELEVLTEKIFAGSEA